MTRTRAFIQESGKLRTAESGKWAATLLTPGVGSSGTYSSEMLAEHGPKAFRKGMKLWWGHPKEGEHAGDRDARDQWGVLEEDATVNENGEVEGTIRLLPHWKDVVESLGDQASLSIYALGEHDKDGNVTALLEHFTNSVDIVSYPGREGSGLKQKLEAARAASTQPGAASAPGSNHTQEESMDEAKVKEIVDSALTEALAPINTFLTEEGARRQAEADAADGKDDVKEAVKAAIAAVEAVKAAKVLPPFEKKLVESAAEGDDITADLAFAVEVTKEAGKATSKEPATGGTFVHESGQTPASKGFALKGGRR